MRRRNNAFDYDSPADPRLVWLAWVLGAAVFILSVVQSQARDSGQWENSDPAISAWYGSLRQPDNPAMSCCGESDAYWADKVEIEDDKVIAIITDDRPDEPLRRPHVPVGTRIEVPPHKLKFDAGNPTGHVVIFLNRMLDVLCYVQNGGV